MMRKTLLVASWGILFLLGADHVFADHISSPVLKLCEAADGNATGTSASDAPIEPSDAGTEKALPKPARSAEDVALAERLQDLIANGLQQYVARPQDRTAVEAFYRGLDFIPLWVNAAGALPLSPKLRKTCNRRSGAPESRRWRESFAKGPLAFRNLGTPAPM